MYRRTRSCLARGQSTFCSYSVTTLLTTYRICIRRFVASLFEGALRPPLDWGERPPPGLWRPWSLARRSFSEGGRSKDAKPGRSNAGAGTRECGLIELVRLPVSRMRCGAKRCTADPGPPWTGTVHASRVYPTCAHWAPISGKPEISVCRKTGKYRDRTNRRGVRVFGSLILRRREAPSRSMRPASPSCFETHRSAVRLWKRLHSRCAAMLLSMRATVSCAFWPNEPKYTAAVVPAKAGTHDHRPVFMGPGSRYARPGRRLDAVTDQPTAVGNERRAASLFPACSLQGTVQPQRAARRRPRFR
jgi:hypothetical protein